jgi:hypothetical protein
MCGHPSLAAHEVKYTCYQGRSGMPSVALLTAHGRRPWVRATSRASSLVASILSQKSLSKLATRASYM